MTGPIRRRLESAWELVNHWRWWLLAALWLTILILGIYGFNAYYDGSTSDRTASRWDQLYLLAHLFTVNLGVLHAGAPWTLHLARFLGVIFSLSLGVAALVTVFRDQVDRLRLRVRPPQVVVLGLGGCGSVAATSFAEAGRRVAAVEQGGGLDVEASRTAGVIVMHGDATDAGLLEALSIYRAETVVVTCGSENLNATVMMRIGEQLQGTRARRWWKGRERAPVHCLVYVEDSALCAVLRRSSAVRRAEENGPLRLEFFNPSSLAAPALLDEHPLLATVDESPPHLLIVGLGEMGLQLLTHAARVWAFSGAEARYGRRLCVTVIDQDATGRLSQQEARDRGLTDHIDTDGRVLDLDVTEAEFVEAAFLDADDRSHPVVTHVVVCLDDDVRAATAALTLRDGLRGRDIQVPVVVRMFHQRGLASVLRAGSSSFTDGIRPLALVDWTCQAEILADLRNELIARSFHQVHLEQGRSTARTGVADPTMRPWDLLEPRQRRSNRDRARHVTEMVASVNCTVRPITGWEGGVAVFTEAEVQRLAVREQERSAAFRSSEATRPDDGEATTPGDGRTAAEPERSAAVDFVRQLPQFLLRAGFFTERIRTADGPTIAPAEPRREALARAVHERYVAQRLREGAAARSAPNLLPWEDLAETLKDSNRDQVDDIDTKLTTIGCRSVDAVEAADAPTVREFTVGEVETLAVHEHDRFVRERVGDGWVYGPIKDVDARTSPFLVPWGALEEDIRELDREAVRSIPDLVGSVGEVIVRVDGAVTPSIDARDASSDAG